MPQRRGCRLGSPAFAWILIHSKWVCFFEATLFGLGLKGNQQEVPQERQSHISRLLVTHMCSIQYAHDPRTYPLGHVDQTVTPPTDPKFVRFGLEGASPTPLSPPPRRTQPPTQPPMCSERGGGCQSQNMGLFPVNLPRG